MKSQQPWFQDEMRYGTRTILAKKWTSVGHRPQCPMKYGYLYNYLYQAIQPSTGKTFEMYIPRMDGDSFKLFISEFAKKHPGQTMIMDNAGSHHVNWEEGTLPDIKIEYLPAYSPDFNPQERMFQEIRKPTKGNVYKDISQIEQDINPKLKEFWDDPIKVKKLTAWSWIV